MLNQLGCVDPDGDGQFHAPQGIALNNSGGIFIADSFNNRVQVFQEVFVLLLTYHIP